MLVIVNVTLINNSVAPGAAYLEADTDGSNPPTTYTQEANLQNTGINLVSADGLLVFWVKNGNYYSITPTNTGGATSGLDSWFEVLF